MTFAIDQCLSTGLGVVAGLGLLYVAFTLIGAPQGTWLQRRIITVIQRDLRKMRKGCLSTDWFNHRAAERLGFLAAYEPKTAAGRALTARGLLLLKAAHRLKTNPEKASTFFRSPD